MKYIKKPFLVEAVQFTGEPENLIEIQALLDDQTITVNYNNPEFPYLTIPFNGGITAVSIGAWVIKEEWGNKVTYCTCSEQDFFNDYIWASEENVKFTVDLFKEKA